ncbi:tRNA threonylcarbamoyladenosine dehydratase [Parvimonas micra]|uniref:tRNA threonylcarbamoyladenosine dehydratase n=1 Tax=Parvimonas micra TaxID=33033 RepID=UPI0020031B74|nr:tRNA threonylcarbamoyladenosine dehydratase [Parvimonas micra]MCK6129808.1 tRNA threonylcarbamoyladenosine dehydratase [Parvimonas micra]MCK6135454.1 tRNA threonylcarbamoyladenosine dehydratase [Parvimonas micra]MCK6136926.1 tRNA threonylcarbamoyladenosine dehydratase [Parvimonas micra]MCK6153453.1 tRNA threonylcarbamoyladenosine dehydratase [Parvimonas micra]MEB3028314.1 tRNA threonylcarbamoyladenosine dehydratase [Parvimonas micra]
MENNIYSRTESLIGKDSLNILKNSKVIVFGIGGVGSFTVESLCRCGIGEISLVDFDTIDITNINRQIHAMSNNIGKYKVDEMKKRIELINPDIKVNTFKKKLDKNNVENFNLKYYDYVVDAIDIITSKIYLIKCCYENNINVISAMGAGNKLDPTRFKVVDIYKTSGCPLARVMRRELKKLGIKKLKCVCSDEISSGEIIESDKIRKSSPSSISFIPSTMGLIITSEVVKDLILWNK